ncbi:hypothetical protein LJR230_000020 [Trinickia sp. LjRoot230]|uniref:Hint domain-containing protein n=1 Tax=Trinickia sp. LjRoot230 TaxID=3342288 RepID=UPI003ECE3C05
MAFECEKYLEPGQMPCTGAHCNKFENTTQFKQKCLCRTSSGVEIPKCQVKGPTTPIGFFICYNKATGEQVLSTADACQDRRDKDRNWTYSECYCCCSCFAYDTRVAISTGEVRYIQNFEEGDPVYVASIDQAGSRLGITWNQRPVVMSAGTGGGSQEMVLVHYGADGEIIVTPDHLFLVPEGKLIRADRLRAGDVLVADDGASVTAYDVQLGLYTGGIHHISAEFTPGAISLDGHLLSANGLVTADYILQISQGLDDVQPYLVADLDQRPAIGSTEYAAAAGSATIFSSHAGAAPRAVRTVHFEPHEAITTPRGVPQWAPRFLTDEQAASIGKQAPHVPVSEELNRANFRYLKELFDGFFPGITLHLEWADETPNLYAFRQFGTQTVYVAGRLLRTLTVKREGLALILAHGIARLLGLSQLDRRGYACTGAADFDAISYVLPTAFEFQNSVVLEAFKQVKELFGFADVNAGGPSKCHEPSLKCRLDALQSGMAGLPLPACAGGPTADTLRLEKAEAVVFEGTPSIIATFNMPVDARSARDITHYVITPESVITTALVAPDVPEQVVLTVTFPDPAAGEYELRVRDVEAEDGSTLDPDRTAVSFKVGADVRPRRAAAGVQS